MYGGVGDDWMNGAEVSARRQVLRGGPGDDRINDAVDVGPSWVYGGRGDDRVYGSYDRDMIVGGPGHDFVELTTDGKPDVVRLRNGGADRLRCHDEGFTELEGEPHDIVFVDKADRVDPYCKGARVLREGRPRLRR